MVKDKDPDAIRLQRIRNVNIEKVVKYGKMSVEDSFDDVLTRVLEEYESMKKKRKQE